RIAEAKSGWQAEEEARVHALEEAHQDALSQQEERLSTQVDILRSQLASVESDLSSRLDEDAVASRIAEAKSGWQAEEEARLRNLQQTHQNNLAEKDSAHAQALAIANDRFAAQKETWENTKSTLQKDLNEEKARTNDVEERLEISEVLLGEARDSAVQASTDLFALQAELKSSKDEITRLNHQLAELATQPLKAEVSSKQRALEEEKQRLKAENIELSDALQEARRRLEDAKSDSEKQSAAIAEKATQDALAELSDEQQRLEQVQKKLQDENKILLQVSQDQKVQIEQLKKMLEEEKESIEKRMQDKEAELMKELKQLKLAKNIAESARQELLIKNKSVRGKLRSHFDQLRTELKQARSDLSKFQGESDVKKLPDWPFEDDEYF
ncbi:MAG: hypothetical protein VX278_22375, partial [Myxococcota bacterium]|nr:hypothetical protein [Myxococcota bacterium]